MTPTPAEPGAPALPDDVVARFRAAAPVLLADGAGLVTLGRRRRRTRRLAAGALAAVVVAGMAGAAVGMLRGPVTPPADGDLTPAPAEVVGSRSGLPAGVPETFAGPVGVLVAPDGRLHVWTWGSSSCPVVPRTVAVTDGVVVVAVGLDPEDGPECTADGTATTTVVALPPAVPLSPPSPVEVRDAETGELLATSSDVPDELEPLTVLEVRDGWPEGEQPGDAAAGLRFGTAEATPWLPPGVTAVWTAGTADCPAVPVAQTVVAEGFVTWITQATEPAGCTGDSVLATWLLATPEGWNGGAQQFGAGPLTGWVPGGGWPGATDSPPACPGTTPTECALKLWVATSIEAAGYPTGGGVPGVDDPTVDSALVDGRTVWADVAPWPGGEGDEEVERTVPVGDVTVAHGSAPGASVVSWFQCGGFRFSFTPHDEDGPTSAADTAQVAEAVAAVVGTCPADDVALVARFADQMATPQG